MSNREMSPDPPAQTPQEAESQLDPEEYDVLDAQLDDLNSALDAIEQRNDQIRAEFFKLLQSNKEIREEIKNEVTPPPPSDGNKD